MQTCSFKISNKKMEEVFKIVSILFYSTASVSSFLNENLCQEKKKKHNRSRSLCCNREILVTRTKILMNRDASLVPNLL